MHHSLIIALTFIEAGTYLGWRGAGGNGALGGRGESQEGLKGNGVKGKRKVRGRGRERETSRIKHRNDAASSEGSIHGDYVGEAKRWVTAR